MTGTSVAGLEACAKALPTGASVIRRTANRFSTVSRASEGYSTHSVVRGCVTCQDTGETLVDPASAHVEVHRADSVQVVLSFLTPQALSLQPPALHPAVVLVPLKYRDDGGVKRGRWKGEGLGREG